MRERASTHTHSTDVCGRVSVFDKEASCACVYLCVFVSVSVSVSVSMSVSVSESVCESVSVSASVCVCVNGSVGVSE